MLAPVAVAWRIPRGDHTRINQNLKVATMRKQRPSRTPLFLISLALTATLIGCSGGTEPATEEEDSGDAPSAIEEASSVETAVDRLESRCFTRPEAYSPNFYAFNVSIMGIVPSGNKAVTWASGYFPASSAFDNPQSIVASCIDIFDFATGEVIPVELEGEYADGEMGLTVETVGFDGASGIIHVAGRLMGGLAVETRQRDDRRNTPVVHLQFDLNTNRWSPSSLVPAGEDTEVFFSQIAGSPTHPGGVIIQKSQYDRRYIQKWRTDNAIIKFETSNGSSSVVKKLPIPVSVENPSSLFVSDDLSQALIVVKDLRENAEPRVVRVDFDTDTVTEVPVRIPDGTVRSMTVSRDFTELFVWSTPSSFDQALAEFDEWRSRQETGVPDADELSERVAVFETTSFVLSSFDLTTREVMWQEDAPLTGAGYFGSAGQPLAGAAGGGLWAMTIDSSDIPGGDRSQVTEEIRKVVGYSAMGKTRGEAPLCDRFQGGSTSTDPVFGTTLYSEVHTAIGVFDIGRDDAVLVACVIQDGGQIDNTTGPLYLSIRQIQ